MYEGLAKHIIWQAITIIMCGALFEMYPDLVLEEVIKQLHSLSCFLTESYPQVQTYYILTWQEELNLKTIHFPKILCSWMIYYFTKYIAYFH